MGTVFAKITQRANYFGWISDLNIDFSHFWYAFGWNGL